MTLQAWMTRNQPRKAQPMTTDIPEPAPEPKRDRWTTAPDSEWLAAWAITALEAGRIELGHHLTNLAVQASRYEKTARDESVAQLLGQHRAPDRAPAPSDAPASESAGWEGIAPDETAVGLAHVAPVITPNGRCVAPTSSGMACHGVAFWDGENQGWTHMHAALDALHTPIVNPTESPFTTQRSDT